MRDIGPRTLEVIKELRKNGGRFCDIAKAINMSPITAKTHLVKAHTIFGTRSKVQLYYYLNCPLFIEGLRSFGIDI